MALDFGDLLGEGPYKKREDWQLRAQEDLRQKLEGKTAWPYQTFRSVLIYLGLTGGHVPATATPNEIDLGPLGQTMSKMMAATNADGNERAVNYYAGLTTGKLIETPIKVGGKDHVNAYIPPDLKTDAKQKRVLGAHSHPSGVEGTIAETLAGADIGGFLKKENVAEVVVFNKGILMAVKTTVTPDNGNPQKIDKGIKDTQQELQQQYHLYRLSRISYGANLSKWLALENGLSLYFGKLGQPLKKVDLSLVVDL